MIVGVLLLRFELAQVKFETWLLVMTIFGAQRTTDRIKGARATFLSGRGKHLLLMLLLLLASVSENAIGLQLICHLEVSTVEIATFLIRFRGDDSSLLNHSEDLLARLAEPPQASLRFINDIFFFGVEVCLTCVRQAFIRGVLGLAGGILWDLRQTWNDCIMLASSISCLMRAILVLFGLRSGVADC